MKIKKTSQLDFSLIYNYEQYLNWEFEERVELYKGRIYLNIQSPGRKHQEVSANLIIALGTYVVEHKLKAYFAPFDVRLFPHIDNKEILTVVQPDICVICDISKLDEKGCLGAPELIIEILSPGNTSKEMKNKYQLYEEAGVEEYWIVDPEHEAVFVYLLKKGKFTSDRPLTTEDILKSKVLEGLEIDVIDIFK